MKHRLLSSNDISPIHSMLRLPITIATVVAMIHMAIGCAWHHGINGRGECHAFCAVQSETSPCSACYGHDHPVRGDSVEVRSDGALCRSGDSVGENVWVGQSGSGHSPCVDDRCTFTRPESVGFDGQSEAVDCGIPVFSWYESAVAPTVPELVVPVCSSRLYPPSLRAHLFLGILTL